MTRMQLLSHPATPMPQTNSLCVSLSLAGGDVLQAVFDCRCDPGVLRLPDARPAQAADELWRHTCCEVFAGVAGDPAYLEFNCSPSGQWARYAFSDYRVRDLSQTNSAMRAPRIDFAVDAKGWTLAARLDEAALSGVDAGRIELGVAVVLEAADGGLSYWALRHAAVQPDFHRRESFVLRLSDLVQGGKSQI